MKSAKQVLLHNLMKGNIVKIKGKDEEPYTLKSGKKSRLFIDIKKATLDPMLLEDIAEAMLQEFPEYPNEYHKIASVAVGGVPIATALSLETYVPQIIIRSEKHQTGIQSQIIGDCKDQQCILIEDVATTGGSIVSAVNAIREAGGICNDVIVCVDREEGAKELCKQNKIDLYSCLKKSDFGLKEEL